MHRAHKIALTLISSTVLLILLGLAHVFSLIFHAPMFWFFVLVACSLEHTLVTFLVWYRWRI